MTAFEMHDRLVELHERLAHLATEHRTLCGARAPDATAVASVRWRIAEAGRNRMELLTGRIFPSLETCPATAVRAAVPELRRTTADYRGLISRYVARWPTAAIVREWGEYQREAEAFRKQVGERLAMERALLLPLLRRAAHGSSGFG